MEARTQRRQRRAAKATASESPWSYPAVSQSASLERDSRASRPRARRKGRSPPQRSNGQVMVKRSKRPRAHRKGRSQEQLRIGEVMTKPRASNGQVMVKRRKRPRAHRKGRSPEQRSNG